MLKITKNDRPLVWHESLMLCIVVPIYSVIVASALVVMVIGCAAMAIVGAPILFLYFCYDAITSWWRYGRKRMSGVR